MTELRVKVRDGKKQIQMRCPGCGAWGDVDNDQAEGLVSCECPECGAHWIGEGHIKVETIIGDD